MPRFAGRAAALCFALVACQGETPARADSILVEFEAAPDSFAPASGRNRAVVAVQLASFADSTQARALADSLGRADWRGAFVQPATVNGSVRYRVFVAPSTDVLLPETVAAALRAGGRDAVVVRDDFSAAAGRLATAHRVNGATQGMSVLTRWILSPDRKILLIVDDPVAVEADAVPNGFIVANEVSGRIARVDSVWHVAPSPDWRRLAFGRAYVLNARERDSLSTAEWVAIARRLGMETADVRRNAFYSSGMAIAFGVAQPGLMDASAVPGSSRLLKTVAGGWRVGWTRDGRLMAGGAPARTQDDAPATRWVAIDTATGAAGASVDASAIAAVPWTEGPALDYSIPVDSARAPLEAGDVVIEGRGGWIRARTGGVSRIVGPGIPLVTTASGRFVGALAPRPRPKDYESKWHLVVYELFDRSTR